MRSRLLASLGLAAALACFGLLGCDSPAPSELRDSSSSTTEATQMTPSQDLIKVNMEFDLSLLSATASAEGILSNGSSQVVTIPVGSTVYDALIATGAQVEGTPAYVSSIDGIGEGQAGAASGWMYMVNGQIPTVAGNELVLNDGDSIKWYYGIWS